MALPVSGKTYRFKCAGANTRYLNLYSSGTASDGMNVVLYTGDSSNEQKWRYDGSKLRPLTNTAFALDKYTVSGNANNNNADIWTANDPTNQNITFTAVSGNTVKIKLAGAALYLTAYSNANGTGTGKTPTSAGNVYWASSSSSTMQQWTFEEVGSTPPITGNYATYPCATMNITQTHSDGNHASYSSGAPVDYPVDDGCADSGRSWLYCPCDQMKIVRIYGVAGTGVNTIWLESTSNVIMPSGTAKLTMMVMHPEDDDLSNLYVNQTFNRGDAMFREGGDGGFANHFHISAGKGTRNTSNNGWAENSNRAWVLSTTGGTIKANQAFYLDTNFTTVKNSKGIVFTTL